jgi:thiamine-monophosphate kinase
MSSEDQLIQRIARSVPSLSGAGKRQSGALRLGIGDDAAVLGPRPGHEWVLSCDQFLDGIHFRSETYPADSVGYKSLARATSDLAAMGAEPRYFLLAMALPKRLAGKWLDGFLRGMARAARESKIRLIGGDTTRNDQVSINLTVIGEIGRGLAVTRSGARPGDVICVSGRLGRAALGLALLESGQRPSRALAPLLQPHLYPEIRIQLGAWLARHRMASAMMDISDGLSTDLARMCKASGVGARLDADKIPAVNISEAAARAIGRRRLTPLEMALHGGEDYELLFTAPRKNMKRLKSAPGFREITPIGEIAHNKKIVLLDANGRSRELKPKGWDPFS